MKLVQAKGENSNPFYHIATGKTPLIAEKADLKGFKLPDTNLFDFVTEAGGVYVFNEE